MLLQTIGDKGKRIAAASSGSTQNSPTTWNPKWTTPARLALLKNGYEPIPLSGKRPVLEGWQNLSATAETIVAWEASHPGAANTGILTRHAPTIDIDVLDREAGDIIHDWVKEELIPPGCPELVRIGRAPKRAFLFRCETPFAKITTGKWLDDQKTEHQLEILCSGQQIVAYGTHPDTGRAYHWVGARPGQTPRTALPLLTPEAAQALVERAKALFQERGWRPKTEERAITITAPRAWCPQPGDDERVADALRYSSPEDHDVWLAVGMALHHHLGEAGRSIWDRWSQGSKKFNLRQQNKSWKAFGKKAGITIATLFYLAMKNGWCPAVSEIQREICRAAGRCIRRETPAAALRTFLQWCDYRGIERRNGLRVFEAIIDKEIAK